MAGAGAVARNAGIDALRAAVTLLVVFHHAALTYGGVGSWYYHEVTPSLGGSGTVLTLFCAVNQAWFMGLFFLLAGYFTPSAFARRGAAGFMRERLLRLGTPLLAYAVVLNPLTDALARTARGREFVWPAHDVAPGPMWFVEALLLFEGGWLLWRQVRQGTAAAGRPFPSNRTLLLAAVGTGVAAFALRLAWPVGVTIAALQPGYFASYVVLFAAGCAACGPQWLVRLPAAPVRRWRRVAVAALPMLPLAFMAVKRWPVLAGSSDGGWSTLAVVYALWEPFVAWGGLLGLLATVQRQFARLGPIWSRLVRRAYLIYIIHPPVLVAVALLWRGVTAPALLKFAVTGVVACFCCYAVAGLLLRAPAVARFV